MCGSSYNALGAAALLGSAAAVVTAPPAPAPAPASAQYPVGSVDFNKPLETDEGDAVTVITVLSFGEFPILVKIDGEEQVEQVNPNGESLSNNVHIKNAPVNSGVVYGRLLREGGATFFDNDTYASEEAARNHSGNYGETLVTVFPVTIPAASEDNGAVDSVVLAGRSIKAGDAVNTYRRGFGSRRAVVVKVRNDVRKSLFIDPQDGNAPYWALNKNIS